MRSADPLPTHQLILNVMLNTSLLLIESIAADGRVFALKQVKLAGMKRVDRQEAIDEVKLL